MLHSFHGLIVIISVITLTQDSQSSPPTDCSKLRLDHHSSSPSPPSPSVNRVLSVLTITSNMVIITYIPPTLTNNSFRMGPKRPNSTPMSGKISTPDVTQGDRGRGQAGQGQGQAGEHQGVFIQAQRSARQGSQTDQGPNRTPVSSRVPSTGSHSPTSPMIQTGSPSDTDLESNPGDNNSPNKGGSPAKGNSQKGSHTAAADFQLHREQLQCHQVSRTTPYSLLNWPRPTRRH